MDLPGARPSCARLGITVFLTGKCTGRLVATRLRRTPRGLSVRERLCFSDLRSSYRALGPFDRREARDNHACPNGGTRRDALSTVMATSRVVCQGKHAQATPPTETPLRSSNSAWQVGEQPAHQGADARRRGPRPPRRRLDVAGKPPRGRRARRMPMGVCSCPKQRATSPTLGRAAHSRPRARERRAPPGRCPSARAERNPVTGFHTDFTAFESRGRAEQARGLDGPRRRAAQS